MAAGHGTCAGPGSTRFDKGNVSTSLKGLEAKGLATIARTSGGRAEAVDLAHQGRNRVAALTVSCELVGNLAHEYSSGYECALAVLLLALESSAWAGAPDYAAPTYEEPTLGRLQTLFSDGSRATSTWSPTLQQWTTTVTPPPGKSCDGRLDPQSPPVGGALSMTEA